MSSHVYTTLRFYGGHDAEDVGCVLALVSQYLFSSKSRYLPTRWLSLGGISPLAADVKFQFCRDDVRMPLHNRCGCCSPSSPTRPKFFGAKAQERNALNTRTVQLRDGVEQSRLLLLHAGDAFVAAVAALVLSLFYWK